MSMVEKGFSDGWKIVKNDDDQKVAIKLDDEVVMVLQDSVVKFCDAKTVVRIRELGGMPLLLMKEALEI